jgi:hypothetical protein
VNVLEPILIYAVPAAGLYLLIWLLVVAPRMARKPRYRVGQPWSYPPLWWTANPKGAHLPSTEDLVVTGDRGGASGNW